MPHTTRDPHAVLGVAKGATQAEIKRAFRRLARRLHPDAGPAEPGAEKRFRAVLRAYSTLTGSRGRARYAPGPGPAGPPRPEALTDWFLPDIGRHSDFYMEGDPLTVPEAARAVQRNESWLRRAIREGRLPAERNGREYLLRRRDLAALDRSTSRRPRGGSRTRAGSEAP